MSDPVWKSDWLLAEIHLKDTTGLEMEGMAKRFFVTGSACRPRTRLVFVWFFWWLDPKAFRFTRGPEARESYKNYIQKPVGGRHSLEVTWPFLFCSQLAQEYSKLSFQPYTELAWFRKFQDDENIIDRIFALSDVDIARMHTTISLKTQFSTC